MRSICFTFFYLLSYFAVAQAPVYLIEGTVIEASSGQTIEFATVVLYDNETKEILSGTTTEEGGKFLIETETKSVYLEISLLATTTY